EDVIIIDNMSRGQNDIAEIERDCRLVLWDIRNPLPRYLEADEVIHAAFINGTRTFYERPDLVLDVGVRGMLNLLDLCRDCAIRKFTLISSSEVCRVPVDIPEATPLVIPDPFNPRYSYSAGKIISEMLAIHCGGLFDPLRGGRLLIARPFNI